MKAVITGIVLLLCISVNAQQARDTLFFTNGSIIVGELKKIKLGLVTFDPDDANDITVQLRKMKTISAGNKIFRIETIDHQLYFGTILSHNTQNRIYVKRLSDTITLALENVSILYPFETSVLQRFSGNVSLGYSYTRSSGLGRLNFGGDIKYVSKKGEVSLSLSGIYTMYDTLLSRDKEEVTAKYNYYFIRNWFATTFLAYQRNIELGLDRRYQEGIGFGNKFITGKSIYTWARGGAAFNQEKSTEGVHSDVLTELFCQLEMNIFKFEKPKINFLLEQTFYYSLSQKGRFRNDGSLNITWEIFKDFNLSFEPYNNYDSKPPVEDSRQFDFGIVFGINYIF